MTAPSRLPLAEPRHDCDAPPRAPLLRCWHPDAIVAWSVWILAELASAREPDVPGSIREIVRSARGRQVRAEDVEAWARARAESGRTNA